MISREKCLEWENEIIEKLGKDALYDWLFVFANRAYAEGQKDMREKAANCVDHIYKAGGGTYADEIRNLELDQ